MVENLPKLFFRGDTIGSPPGTLSPFGPSSSSKYVIRVFGDTFTSWFAGCKMSLSRTGVDSADGGLGAELECTNMGCLGEAIGEGP